MLFLLGRVEVQHFFRGKTCQKLGEIIVHVACLEYHSVKTLDKRNIFSANCQMCFPVISSIHIKRRSHAVPCSFVKTSFRIFRCFTTSCNNTSPSPQSISAPPSLRRFSDLKYKSLWRDRGHQGSTEWSLRDIDNDPATRCGQSYR